MARITLFFLAVGAFAYAVWLVLAGKPLPQPGRTRGLKRRFLLAALLFVGLLSHVSRGRPATDAPTALAGPDTSSHAVEPGDLWVTIKAVWRTLDPNQAEVFRQHLETAVAEGQVRQRVCDMLSTAFAEIAARHALTRQDDPSASPTPLPRSFDSYPEYSSGRALGEIEYLRAIAQAGNVNEVTSESVHAVLAREIEMMWLLGRASLDEWMALEALWQRYASSPTSAPPIDSAAVAAKIMVELEGWPTSFLTSAARFRTMEDQVHRLFRAGPAFSDWYSTSVSPNILSMLQELGLAEVPRPTCYRSLPRVTERTAELQELQAELLEQCVDANIIDEQIAAWAADPNGADPNAADFPAVALPVDFALDAEIRAYQKQIRCVMFKLYERGEVPSSFVRGVELAADVEILPVEPNEARRRDMGYFFHALLDCPARAPFVAALEDRDLIPPAQNHRMVAYNYSDSCEADPDQDALAEFISLLDSGGDVALDRDALLIWPACLLPTEDIDYRMTLRRACRILTKLGYTDSQWRAAVDEVIGIPVVATISEETDEIIREEIRR